MNQITVTKTIKFDKMIKLNPHSDLTELKCTLCHQKIGTLRPIALVWDEIEDKPHRICKPCINQIVRVK